MSQPVAVVEAEPEPLPVEKVVPTHTGTITVPGIIPGVESQQAPTFEEEPSYFTTAPFPNQRPFQVERHLNFSCLLHKSRRVGQ